MTREEAKASSQQSRKDYRSEDLSNLESFGLEDNKEILTTADQQNKQSSEEVVRVVSDNHLQWALEQNAIGGRARSRTKETWRMRLENQEKRIKEMNEELMILTEEEDCQGRYSAKVPAKQDVAGAGYKGEKKGSSTHLASWLRVAYSQDQTVSCIASQKQMVFDLTTPEQTATGKKEYKSVSGYSFAKNYKANLVGLLLKKMFAALLKDKLQKDSKRFKETLDQDQDLSEFTIPHNLSNLVVTEFNSTEKLVNKIGELRVISGHVLGASRVQIPQNNLDNLRSTEEEEDGATEVLDPRDVPGSILLEIIDFAILGLLLEPLVFGTLGLLV
ncbi:hypothetical protein Tco_0126667 [Tanacetum coccineum]